jgi:hypothetical protein
MRSRNVIITEKSPYRAQAFRQHAIDHADRRAADNGIRRS